MLFKGRFYWIHLGPIGPGPMDPLHLGPGAGPAWAHQFRPEPIWLLFFGMGAFIAWYLFHETYVGDTISMDHSNYLLATANALICFKGIMHLRIFQEMRVLINMIG